MTSFTKRQYSLNELAAYLNGKIAEANNQELQIAAPVFSSKHSIKNSIYVAVPGVNVDGHEFIEEAFSNGSIAAVVSKPESLEGRPGIIVPNSRIAISQLGSLLSG